ncbi:MAG TPA: hypothetical protein VHW42_05860 [Actinomycetes bacterium]|jgi:hypothetical protein|nr:hypothetical protein [Actinomycetes bacterium]
MPRPRQGPDVRLQPRTRSLLAWPLWLATLGFCAAGLAVTLAVTQPLTIAVLAEGAAKALAYPLGYATIGLVLTLRRPGNPIGWLYAAAGLVWSLAIPGDAWLGQLVAEHRPLPLAAQVAAVCGEFNWAPATVLGVTLPALLVPDGRLRSPRWWPVAASGIAAAVLVVVGGGLAPARLENTSIANPFGLSGPAGAVAGMLVAAGTLLWAATMVASLACVVVRFRSSSGVERQQLRWVAAGAVAAVAGLLAGAAVPQNTVLSSILYAMVLCIPLAVAVAVLRYRLWDLDRLVSRTVTYAVVTALLVVPYLLIVPAAGRLVQGSGSLAVAAATLAAAAAFAPLRRRVQGLVDRRFNRRRYNAARTVEGFAARLRDQVDLDALSAELLAVVDHTMQPVGASLWLRSQAAPTAPETTLDRLPEVE